MVKNRDLVIAVLITFCLAAMLFLVKPIRSQINPPYNPMFDLNDDGVINMRDIALLARDFGTSGTPINKTQFLLEQDEIDSLNSSISVLQSEVDSLNASNLILQSQVSKLEGNNSVTNLMLAPYAIPFNSTSSSVYNFTTEQYPNWNDMPYMSITLNLSRASQLMIMFSGELQNLGPNTARENTWICLRAMINSDLAIPSEFNSTAVDPTGATGLVYHDHYLRWGTYSYSFYSQTLTAGFYTIKIQWDCTVGKAETLNRELTVIALPSS